MTIYMQLLPIWRLLSVTTLKYKKKIDELVLSTFKSEFGATIESILKAFHFPSQASIKSKQINKKWHYRLQYYMVSEQTENKWYLTSLKFFVLFFLPSRDEEREREESAVGPLIYGSLEPTALCTHSGSCFEITFIVFRRKSTLQKVNIERFLVTNEIYK